MARTSLKPKLTVEYTGYTTQRRRDGCAVPSPDMAANFPPPPGEASTPIGWTERIDRPPLVRAGAWCAFIVSAGWLLLIIATTALLASEDFGIELIVLAVIPLFGLVMSIRLIRNNDDVFAMFSLVPLHLLGTIPMLTVTFVGIGSLIGFAFMLCVTTLTAAPPVLFWLDARSWGRR